MQFLRAVLVVAFVALFTATDAARTTTKTAKAPAPAKSTAKTTVTTATPTKVITTAVTTTTGKKAPAPKAPAPAPKKGRKPRAKSPKLAPAPVPAPAPAPGYASVYAAATAAGLTELQKALKLVDLTSAVKNKTLDYAVLAPTNEAFTRTFKALNTTAAELADTGELLDIMLYHLYGYPLTIADFLFNVVSYSQLDTDGLQTVNCTSEAVDDTALVEFISYGSTAYLIKGDIVAGDSYVHIIDDVLIPDLSTVATF